MKHSEEKKIIVSQYRDAEGFYVAKVDVSALQSKGETYEQRLDDAIQRYHTIVEGNRTVKLTVISQ